jgi:hypothetical protein
LFGYEVESRGPIAILLVNNRFIALIQLPSGSQHSIGAFLDSARAEEARNNAGALRYPFPDLLQSVICLREQIGRNTHDKASHDQE